jgi:hypothetical protein
MKKTSYSLRKSKSVRLNCQIDSNLHDWIFWYARQENTTVTRIVTDYLKRLRVEYRTTKVLEVDQI